MDDVIRPNDLYSWEKAVGGYIFTMFKCVCTTVNPNEGIHRD